MSKPPAPMSLSDADYEAIEGAVVETNRGRWFLAEFARRNRHADTTMLLAAIDRLEAAMRGERTAESVDRIRFDLVEMATAIARTKAEIAAIKPDAEQHGKFGEATAELDSIVSATETATSSILAAAEQIQEVAWTLREQGLEAEVCDMLDAKATEVYTACSFQDLTGQRTGKVIQVLRYLEGRINAMIDIWGLDGAMAAEAAETARARHGEAALISGPARPGHGLDQADVDVVMGSAAVVATAPVRDAHAVIDVKLETAPVAPSGTASIPAAPPTPATGLTLYRAPTEPAAPLPAPAPAAPPVAPQARFSAHDPMALLDALSAEEKIALFS
jgi:chemotaxis protein CheZ